MRAAGLRRHSLPAWVSGSRRALTTMAAATTLAASPRHSALLDQNVFAWGFARIGNTMAELPAKALETASQCMTEKSGAHARGSSVMDFFDPGARRCVLCNLPITTTNQAHIGRHEHQARLGIVERSLTLIHTVVLDTQRHQGVAERGRTGSRRSAAMLSSPFALREERMLFRQLRTPQSLLGIDESLLQQDPMALQKIDFVDLLTKKWWNLLDASTDLNAVSGCTAPNNFNRLSHLSSPVSSERRWRLRYLLDWLKYHGVLQSSLSIANANISPEAFSRSQRFEVLEMVGDCVVKVELPDRLTRLFPHGVCSKLALFQRLIDSNSGLLDIYDWLKLDQIIGAKLANSKAKADVVECIFGELQCFLWATEVSSDPINTYAAHPAKEFRHLRAVVQHTMHELMHAVFMWRLETTLESAADFIQGHALEFKRHRGPAAGQRKLLAERDMNRGRYSTLPLLTAASRPHGVVALSAGEAWYQSTHRATTRAGPQQTVLEMLSPKPLVKSIVFSHQLEHGALRLVTDGKRMRRLQAEIKKEASALSDSPSPTKAAQLYSQWRAEERRSRENQRLCHSVADVILSPEQTSALLKRRLRHFSLDCSSPEMEMLCEAPALQAHSSHHSPNPSSEISLSDGLHVLQRNVLNFF